MCQVYIWNESGILNLLFFFFIFDMLSDSMGYTYKKQSLLSQKFTIPFTTGLIFILNDLLCLVMMKQYQKMFTQALQ